MNAVMARIFGLAGSGGALRWAWTQGAKKINAEQRKTGKRKLPRRMGDLQMGRSGACLPQAGCAPTRYRIWQRLRFGFEMRCSTGAARLRQAGMLGRYKGAPHKEGD